jgi:hypothetical protein
MKKSLLLHHHHHHLLLRHLRQKSQLLMRQLFIKAWTQRVVRRKLPPNAL